MNYRHAFHAGNHADVLKHLVLAAIVRRLIEKPAPIAVLDTHAGIGVYDLTGDAAIRTGEAASGIERLRAAGPLALAPFLDLVGHAGPYPGSPAIARRLLRPVDRLIACELHPEDHATLRRWAGADPQIHIHHRDGYEAVTALLPPPERRGLVLIDPPFERTDEAARATAAVIAGYRRWPQGVYVLWYPHTSAALPERLLAELAGSGITRLATWTLALAPAGAGLRASSVAVVNQPWQLEATLAPQLAAAAEVLGGTWMFDEILTP